MGMGKFGASSLCMTHPTVTARRFVMQVYGLSLGTMATENNYLLTWQSFNARHIAVPERMRYASIEDSLGVNRLGQLTCTSSE